MKMARSVTALVATTMLATSVSPALAQGYPGGGYGYPGQGWDRDRDRHYRRDRGVSAGDVIAGVAIFGVLAAVIGAASRSNSRNGGYNNQIGSEDQAADACASRIEQRYGNNARVGGIDDVQRTRDGYFVRGTIETNNRYNSSAQRFSCSVRYGQVDDLQIDNGYAYRGY